MKIVAFLFALLLSLMADTGLAREIEGIQVLETVTLTGTRNRLVLNGAGVRANFLTKLYVGALYLQQFSNNADAILQPTKPKRVALYILGGEGLKEKLAEDWQKGFRNNHTEPEFNAFKPQLAQFNGLFDKVVKGDLVLLDYQQKSGTSVYINGQLKGTMPGKEFNQALLKVWLGKDPIDKSLKQAMLGAE